MPWIKNSTLVTPAGCHTYDVYHQSLEDNCTVAVLIMMAKYALGKDLFLAGQPLQRLARHDISWRWGGPQAVASGPVTKAPVIEQLYSSLQRHYPQLDWSLGTCSREAPEGFQRELEACSLHRPAAVAIRWTFGQSVHAALCVGLDRGELVYLDPAFGVVTVRSAVRPHTMAYHTRTASIRGPVQSGVIEAAVFSS